MPRKTVYSGLSVIEVGNLDAFYKDGKIALEKIAKRRAFNPNENLVLKGTKGSALAIVKGTDAVKVPELTAFGVQPKNKEQTFALNLLMDPSIVCVTLTGPAGTGKSLLAVAAALQQSIGARAEYRKVIYIRNVHAVGKEIGYLPGNLQEKISPFMGPLLDSIGFFKGTKDFDKLIGWDDNDKVQMMASAFVRGRTFRKSFVIVDEAQNMNTHEIKTILSRLDDTSKVVLLGDVDQSDIRLRPEDEGLIKVVEVFRDDAMFASIDLIKSERSRLAQMVAERL